MTMPWKWKKDGEWYYRFIARQVDHEGIRNILTMLANAELAHYKIFQQMKNNENVVLADSPFLAGVKNIFLEMAESGDISLLKATEIDLYRKAQEIEQKSIDFYLERAKEGGDDYATGIFLKVTEEEKKHYFTLGKLIDFVSRPGQWLDNPKMVPTGRYLRRSGSSDTGSSSLTIPTLFWVSTEATLFPLIYQESPLLPTLRGFF